MYVLDLKKELGRSQVRKDIFAFAGFALSLPGAPNRQGVLTITLAPRPDGSGQLKCKFMVDLEGATSLCAAASTVFRNLAAEALDTSLGQDFEYIVPLAAFEVQDKVWFVQEADFSLKNVKSRAREFIAERLLPTLTRRLPIVFHDLEWWGEG